MFCEGVSVIGSGKVWGDTLDIVEVLLLRALVLELVVFAAGFAVKNRWISSCFFHQ